MTTTPSVPAIHYDYVLGVTPQYRGLIAAIQAGQMTAQTAGIALDGSYYRSRELLLQSLSDYDEYGREVYVLGPHLQEMLCNTELGDIPRDLLRFTYPCFYVALPDCKWRIWDTQSGWHQVTGFYIRSSGEDHPAQFSVFIWGRENDNSRFAGDDTVAWFDFNLDITYNKAGGLEPHLEKLLGHDEGDTSDPHVRLSTYSEEQQAACRESMRNVLRAGINLILYLQSKDPETRRDTTNLEERGRLQKEIDLVLGRAKNPKKGEKKVRRIRREQAALPDAKITWIGERIETKARAQVTGLTRGRSFHWVPGHWWPKQDTAYHRARERWVLPYPRNLDFDPAAKSRHYHFKEGGAEAPEAEKLSPCCDAGPTYEADGKGGFELVCSDCNEPLETT